MSRRAAPPPCRTFALSSGKGADRAFLAVLAERGGGRLFHQHMPAGGQRLERGSILLGQALREAGEHHEQKGNERNRAADEREAAARCGDFSDC